MLQLLEAHCNLSLSELACSARPKIYRSTKFDEYLEAEVVKMEVQCIGEVTPMFSIIQNEEDYQQVLLNCRAFRHWGHPFIDYTSWDLRNCTPK